MKTNALFVKGGVLATLFFIFAIQLNAQQNYKLADYVNPNYFYHSLNFTANLNANGNFSLNEPGNSTLSRTNNSSLNGDFGISYYQIKNTTRYQGTQSMSLHIAGGWNRSSQYSHNTQTEPYTITSKNKSRAFDPQFNYSSTNLFYNSRKQFLEIDPQIGLKLGTGRTVYNENPITYPFHNKTHTGSHNVSLGLSVMVGTGRIENVENARLALYILNDLQKSGDIKKNLSNKQVNQLAYFLTKLRNKRFFDSRIRNIATITSIDSLITSMGIREHAGASYFMILNDDWNYANGPVRQTGHRFAFGVTSGYSNYFLKYTNDSILSSGGPSISRLYYSDKSQLSSINFGAYYYLEKPVNLTWQHSTRVSLGYEMNKQFNSSGMPAVPSSGYKTTLYSPNLHFSFEKIYGYYPTSRTNLALDCMIEGLYYMPDQKGNPDLKSNQLSLNAYVNLSGNYYFSPQLRLNLNAGVSDNFQHFDNNIGTSTHVLSRNNVVSRSISLSLLYSIF